MTYKQLLNSRIRSIIKTMLHQAAERLKIWRMEHRKEQSNG